MKTYRAFTLIELLVVMAIVGILAGLLLPTLARAKMVAKGVQNKNNLKQIASAFAMYVDDHGGLAVGIGESSGRYFFGKYKGPWARTRAAPRAWRPKTLPRARPRATTPRRVMRYTANTPVASRRASARTTEWV